MAAFAIPVAAPLIGPGAGAALGGALVGAGALIRELMLRENLSPQFYDFRRSQDLENIGGGVIRLSDFEILERLIDDAIRTPVNFPSPPNLPEILGPWLQSLVDWWTYTPTSPWGQLNSRTFRSSGPGQGEWKIFGAKTLSFTYQWDLNYTYPLGNGTCQDGPDGGPRDENYPKQDTETFTDVQQFSVKMQDVTLQRICGATASPSGQEAAWRTMVITQDGFDYVTENKAETGTEVVTGNSAPRTQVQTGRAISLVKDGVEQLVPIPGVPVPGTTVPVAANPAAAPAPNLNSAVVSGGIPIPSTAQPIPQDFPVYVPPAVPSLPTTAPVAPPVPEELTNFGIPVPPRVVATRPTDHVIDQDGDPLRIPGGTASPNITQIAQEVSRIEQKAKQILDGLPNKNSDFNWAILWGVIQLLQELLEQDLPEETYSLYGVCEDTDDEQPATSVTLPPEKWAERLISLGDMLPILLQAQKDYKQPICGSTNEKPPLEGQWVTTRWESVEKMAHSGRRLRKLFRYRTKSSRDLGQLSSYWQAFTWQAGDVCVRHTGAWWGDPQVWAASQEEGERVIRFAAAEAGIDPDQDGQWRVSSSRSPRYGMSGTMKVALFEGFPWIASRDGAEWPNVLAKASDP